MSERMIRKWSARARFYLEHGRYDFALAASGSNSCRACRNWIWSGRVWLELYCGANLGSAIVGSSRGLKSLFGSSEDVELVR